MTLLDHLSESPLPQAVSMIQISNIKESMSAEDLNFRIYFFFSSSFVEFMALVSISCLIMTTIHHFLAN